MKMKEKDVANYISPNRYLINSRFHTVAFESPSLSEDLLVASHT